MATAFAEGILWLLDLRRRRRDLTHLLGAFFLLLAGIGVIASAALTDQYLHRGVESGSERPYVVHPSGRELSTNIDLRRFSVDEVREVAVTLADAGFGYVRQEFSWAEIEPSQGAFEWDRYDAIVRTMSAEGIEVIAVIVDAPGWSAGGDVVASTMRPPSNPEDLGTFANALAARFGEDVPYIQVWDRPNLAANWGGRAATGADFEPYLAAAFYGARSGNPTVQIVTPELALVPDVAEGLNDLDFLRSLYEADARAVFDVVGIVIDGGSNSPDDRRVGPDRLNFSRAILVRELMVRRDDGATPVWATSYGWSAGENVSREEQAEYVVRGLERAWSEWPWMGLMIQWSFVEPSGTAAATYTVAPDGSSTPLFRRLTDPALQQRSEHANTGFAPMDADAVVYQGNWDNQHLEGRTFRTTNLVGSSTTVTFQGTGLIAFLRSGPNAGPFLLELDGKVIPGGYVDNDDLWSYYISFRTDDLPRRLLTGLEDTEHTVKITLSEPGELTLGGFVVEREPPFIWPVILLTISGAAVLFLGVRSLIYLVAIRSGHLRRREDDSILSIPVLPHWQVGGGD